MHKPPNKPHRNLLLKRRRTIWEILHASRPQSHPLNAPKRRRRTGRRSSCGTEVEILESSGAYRRVRTAYYYEGWVLENTLFPLPPQNSGGPHPRPLSARPLQISNMNRRYRLLPLCTLPRGHACDGKKPLLPTNGKKYSFQTARPDFFPLRPC